MKTLLGWATRLFPAAWRARYGDEMEALLDDVAPGAGDLWDLVKGALFVRMTSLSFWKILAGCTVAGVLAAGIWSVTLPQRYVSTSVVRIGADPSSLDRLQVAQQAALSRRSLAEIIRRPNLNLYASERKQIPLEDVIQQMRNRDLRLRRLDAATFTVEFASQNPATAQATVQALVDRLIELNAAGAANPGDTAAPMEVVSPASLAPYPQGPRRMRVMASGLGVGLVLGLVCGAVWSLKRRNQRWSLRRIATFAAAGMALGITVALLIPNEFISIAVLRAADQNRLQSALAHALSDESLAAIVRQEHLYPRELARNGMSDVTRAMRDRFIRVQAAQPGPLAAITISFRYPDRFVAQSVTRELVARRVGPQPRPGVVVVDAASDPQLPSSPNRTNIALMGTVLGILLGLASSRYRRPKLATA